MRLLVGDRALDIVDHRSARLRDLIDLTGGTRRWVPAGLRQHRLEDLSRAARTPGFTATADGELWIAAVVFLSRRGAGEVGTVAELLDCHPVFVADPDDEDGQGGQPLVDGPATTGARWPGDTRSRRRPAGRAEDVSWPFDDVQASLAEWLLVVGHYWPGITPLTVYDLPAHWWAAYVQAAHRLTQPAPSARR